MKDEDLVDRIKDVLGELRSRLESADSEKERDHLWNLIEEEFLRLLEVLGSENVVHKQKLMMALERGAEMEGNAADSGNSPKRENNTGKNKNGGHGP